LDTLPLLATHKSSTNKWALGFCQRFSPLISRAESWRVENYPKKKSLETLSWNRCRWAAATATAAHTQITCFYV